MDEVDVNELLGRVDVNAVLERVDVNRLLDPVDPHDPTTGKHVSVGTFSTQADANVALRQAGAAKDRGGWVSPGRGEGDRCNYLTGWIESNQRIRSPRTRGLYEAPLRLHIAPTLGEVAIGKVTPSAVRRWHTKVVLGV